MKKIFFFFLLITGFSLKAQQIKKLVLFSDKKTDYGMFQQNNNSVYEGKALDILQKYIHKVSGITAEKNTGKFLIKISDVGGRLAPESFTIKNEGNNILIEGNGKGLVYAAYTFVEKILGCRKFNPKEEAYCPQLETLEIPLPLKIAEKPGFIFREVYSLAESDEEYRDWHKLHHLENLWGIWGHSFSKLVPVSLFESHPEYFAYYDGKRHPTQLCLSNENVFKLSTENLQKSFNQDPDAKYWSISQNDNSGFCECKFCRATDLKEGGHQGSLLKFVNKIANHYPHKTFTTLAYNTTAKPPLITKPEKNVIIFLSNIEVKRTFGVKNEASAKTFRRNLKGWSKKTDRVFIWDYYAQFTNFLAPFPIYFTIQPNINYYKNGGVQGVFAQLNGPTYGDFAELKTYVLAKLLWNPNLDQNKIINDFLKEYYHDAAPYVKSYMETLYRFAVDSGINLDIYGNSVNSYNDFLNPKNLSELYRLIDQAEEIEKDNSVVLQRLARLKLSLEFTFLQQAKLYGPEKYSDLNNEELSVNDNFKDRVNRFVDQAEKAGVKELSEEGISPKEYGEEWEELLSNK